jgi:hypothetical protein
VGILLDKERDIYEIIESLQSGSLIGFQFIGKFNTFTARLDNPNRPQAANIKRVEILNLDIDRSNRRHMLDRHRIEKVYKAETLLPDKSNAELKGKLILKDFAELRPVINGIKLFGFEWFDLRVYDIITIDFFIEGTAIDLAPRHVVRRCKIMRREINPNTGVVTLNVRRQDASELLPSM